MKAYMEVDPFHTFHAPLLSSTSHFVLVEAQWTYYLTNAVLFDQLIMRVMSQKM